MDNLTEMLKGVLEGCVLEIIGREETYGYEITRRLNALGFADVVEGTVYASTPFSISVRLSMASSFQLIRATGILCRLVPVHSNIE